MKKHIWRQALVVLIPCALIFIGGIILSAVYGSVRSGSIERRMIAFTGVVLFTIFSIAFLHVLTNAISKVIIFHRLGIGRAASLKFILRTFGYLTILLTALDRIGIPVGHILLGSAVLGIILGVAAQQALANFFASIVLIVAHPFTIGQELTLVSGALGGQHTGEIIDIGLTHTHLKESNGTVVALPNSTLLIGAAIKVHHKSAKS
jgi:small-conductance mechanosensitive channel